MTIVIVLFAILAAGILLVAYGIFKALNKIIVNPSPKKEPINLRSSSNYNLLLHRLLIKIKDLLNAPKVFVGRFHDGGEFNNGLHMEKFSIWAETPSSNDKIPILQDYFRDIFNTRYPEIFPHLIVWGEYLCADLDCCEDIGFKRDFKRLGFCSVNFFLVKQLDNTEEGFVGICYRDTHVMTPEERSKVTSELATIRGFLNMTNRK
jgi:hypothetical protein